MEQHIENYIPTPTTKIKDRSDRATNEQVLDHRTRVVLATMIRNGLIKELHGSVSTGKEANVYHGFGEEFELAIKIFKTSILIFKDRERYVEGDYRYRKGFCRSNPRKMVTMWAEKEMRNLKRLGDFGIPAPRVLRVKNNVLVMEFLGEDGWAAPRLKDAPLNDDEKNEAYRQTVCDMHRMYNKCNMVHADLSEYNLLWWKGLVYVIDVGQAIELSHPSANDFLRMDCVNISNFYNKIGVHTLSPKDLFDLVTNPSIKESSVLDIIKQRFSVDWEKDTAVFLNSFLPNSLQELNKPLRDVFQPKKMTGVVYLPNAIPKHIKLTPLQVVANDDSASEDEINEMKVKKEKKEMKEKLKQEKKARLEAKKTYKRPEKKKENKKTETQVPSTEDLQNTPANQPKEEQKVVQDVKPEVLVGTPEDTQKECQEISSEESSKEDGRSEPVEIEKESEVNVDEMNSEEYIEYVTKLKEAKRAKRESDIIEEKKKMKEHKKEYCVNRREKLKEKIPKKKKQQMIKHSKRNQTKN
ncbi:serine/threonine protein kinase RIO1, putative [Entamoeba invadens IP1]|uniref:Serine/threonine-protein kinase RIO1 n=1 Tax=Entamoeba invadens IP1 TaxID=370355 RepID=A0A0A1U5V4_ENTIV|nr:serine/threonine protein kinase RIO1, putative [Entamoeba invadens IP1]ELP89768.1 serine/threonine protein kinase RIO1, putative [Entamoeba invadens IP1]|eukprot:XP_004256539.1 serine/threonine protein kinase RIO1, putative [Entamoeba invadens IP1]